MKLRSLSLAQVLTPALLAVSIALIAAPSAAFTFGATGTIPTGQRPDGLAAGDFDRDGDTDIAVTTDFPDKMEVILSNGNGTFSAGSVLFLPGGSGAGAMAAADVDADGDTDVAICLHNSNQVILALNQGNGIFVAGPSVGVGLNPRDIATSDLNNDGRPDFVTANRDGNSATVLINTGGSLVASNVATGAEPRAVATGDLTGDGLADFVVTNHDDRTVSVFRNNGGGSFGQTVLGVAGERPEGVAIGNFDGDGDLDFAVATDRNDVGFAGVYLNNGSGVFAGPTFFASGQSNPSYVAAGDLNGDGRIDLALVDENINSLALLPGAGNGTFGGATQLATGANPDDILLADVTRDGALDIFVSNRNSNNVSFWINASGPTTILPSGFSATRGTLTGGQLSDLFQSDDLRVVIRNVVSPSPATPNVQLTVEGTVGRSTVNSLTFRFEGQSNGTPSTAIVQRIELFDFSAGRWEQVDQRNPSNTDQVVNVTITTNASRFIDSSTTATRARVSWFDRGATSPGWVSRTDQTVWLVQ